VVAILGPTAAGKSALAMDLASRWGAEIVNGDAFCVYRGMDIGTAKPSSADRETVVHHLIDTHEVSEPLDVAWYQAHARAAIDEVVARGRVALLVGGSGLYVQAALDDLRFPGTDAAVRARLEAELEQSGPEVMHRRLQAVDPAAAAQILATNGRRIVRALEVNEITGRPFTATLGPARPWCDSLRIGWDPGTGPVDAAIAARVEHMWTEGLVAEVDRLLPQLRAGRTASRAVGYRQILDAIASGQDPDAAREPTIVATRRLARRQRAWFRRDPSVRWAQSPSQVDAILGTLGL
jgi:tRNA dimethylallyltransferase